MEMSLNRESWPALVATAFGGAAVIAFLSLGAQGGKPGSVGGHEGQRAPEIPNLDPSAWAGPPASLASLRGRVVLLNVWTFGCINCERTLPWVKSIVDRYEDRGVSVIGIHSPEFDRERDPAAVEAARRRFGLAYPSFIDNRHLYWRALDNRYWPTVYVIDRDGVIRAVAFGEIHEGDERARRLEGLIDWLLAKPIPPPSPPAR
jgi:thiol-disulfide isomerase/thioredoxin